MHNSDILQTVTEFGGKVLPVMLATSKYGRCKQSVLTVKVLSAEGCVTAGQLGECFSGQLAECCSGQLTQSIPA